jgi:HSP20 family molecular chaperone IbpA
MKARILVNPKHLNRDEFLTPFDKIFDQLMAQQFPTFQEDVGVSFNQGAYPKVNVYEYDDKIGIIAEIPGLDKKNVTVDVEEDVLTISGDKHGFEDDGGKCITRELKQSSFKRSFNLGEHLDGTNVAATFKDGMLSISIPKREPELPKKTFVKIA